MCEYIGKDSKNLRVHKLPARIRKSYKTVCAICGGNFGTVELLRQNLRVKHDLDSEEKKSFGHDQFGTDESLEQLVRNKAQIISTHVVQQTHLVIFNFVFATTTSVS